MGTDSHKNVVIKLLFHVYKKCLQKYLYKTNTLGSDFTNIPIIKSLLFSVNIKLLVSNVLNDSKICTQIKYIIKYYTMKFICQY